jgi:Papain family cysteine protease
VDTSASYPYKAVASNCKFNAANVGAKVKGFVSIKAGDEAQMKTIVGTVGPVAVWPSTLPDYSFNIKVAFTMKIVAALL